MVPRKAPEGSRITCETSKSLLPSTDAAVLPDANGLPEPSEGCDSHAASSSPTSRTPTSLLICCDSRPSTYAPQAGNMRSVVGRISVRQYREIEAGDRQPSWV